MFKLSSLIALLALAFALSRKDEQPATAAAANLSTLKEIHYKPASNVTVSDGSVWAAYPRQGYEFILSFRDSTATVDLPSGEQFTKRGLDIYQSAPGEWETLLDDGGYLRVNSKTGCSSAKIKGKSVHLLPEKAE